MELMFRSRGFHPFVTVAIEQEKYLPLTRLPRGEFNLFALLGTDLLHQVCGGSSVGRRAFRCRVGGVSDAESRSLSVLHAVQFLEGFVPRACLLAIYVIMHSWKERGRRLKHTKAESKRAGKQAYERMLVR